MPFASEPRNQVDPRRPGEYYRPIAIPEVTYVRGKDHHRWPIAHRETIRNHPDRHRPLELRREDRCGLGRPCQVSRDQGAHRFGAYPNPILIWAGRGAFSRPRRIGAGGPSVAQRADVEADTVSQPLISSYCALSMLPAASRSWMRLMI